MDWPTFQGLATVAGGIAGFVILFASAAGAAARLWQYRVIRAVCWPIRFVAVAVSQSARARTHQIIDDVVRPVVRSEIDQAIDGRVPAIVANEVHTLMVPNGGNSVADVSAKVSHLESQVGQLAMRLDRHLDESNDRAAELSRSLRELTVAVLRRQQ